jgi:poly(A) polymerase
MDNPFENIQRDGRFCLIAELAEFFAVEAFLVGGGLRDAVMGRAVRDFDFALSGAEEELPKELACRVGGSFFWLDRERRQSRVVTGRGVDSFTFDFAPLRGRNLHEDLTLRDFTVNSLALPATKAHSPLIDPLDGVKDITEGRIRACGERSFDDDPLRLMRAIRFAATLGFEIDGDTWSEMVKRPALLDSVAGERIRDEFFLILNATGIGSSLEMLRRSGLLAMMVPRESRVEESPRESEERIARTYEVERVLEKSELHFPDDRKELSGYLQRRIEGGVTLLSLVKLAAFLAGEDAVKRIELYSARLCLGTKAGNELKSLCRWAASFPPMTAEMPGDRILFRFFRDREPAGPELVVLPLAAGVITRELAVRLVSYYFHDYRPQVGDLLLSGNQVMALLNVGPGQELGRVMEMLREAESIGEVSTAAEAREFLLKNQLTNREPMGYKNRLTRE